MAAGTIADMFGVGARIALLELGEAHGANAYQRRLPKLDSPSRAFVARQLLPSQALTREWVDDLKRGARISFAPIDR